MSTVKYPVGIPEIRQNPALSELALETMESGIAVAVYKAEFLAPTDCFV